MENCLYTVFMRAKCLREQLSAQREQLCAYVTQRAQSHRFKRMQQRNIQNKQLPYNRDLWALRFWKAQFHWRLFCISLSIYRVTVVCTVDSILLNTWPWFRFQAAAAGSDRNKINRTRAVTFKRTSLKWENMSIPLTMSGSIHCQERHCKTED